MPKSTVIIVKCYQSVDPQSFKLTNLTCKFTSVYLTLCRMKEETWIQLRPLSLRPALPSSPGRSTGQRGLGRTSFGKDLRKVRQEGPFFEQGMSQKDSKGPKTKLLKYWCRVSADHHRETAFHHKNEHVRLAPPWPDADTGHRALKRWYCDRYEWCMSRVRFMNGLPRSCLGSCWEMSRGQTLLAKEIPNDWLYMAILCSFDFSWKRSGLSLQRSVSLWWHLHWIEKKEDSHCIFFWNIWNF